MSYVAADNIVPNVTIVYPQNLTYKVNVSTLNYKVIEDNPESCWYSVDGGATNSSVVNSGINFTNIISNEGSNTWSVYCNDTSGNEDNDFVTFFSNPSYFAFFP